MIQIIFEAPIWLRPRDAFATLLQLPLVEAEDVEVAAVSLQSFQESSEVVLLPLTPLLVVAEGALAGELVGHLLDDGGEFERPEVLGGAVAHVAGVDSAVGLGEDGPSPEKLGVCFDAAAEVLEALVLDRAVVPGRGPEGEQRDGAGATGAACSIESLPNESAKPDWSALLGAR